MTTKAVDDLLEDYGVPYEILNALTEESADTVLQFIQTAVERDRHALTAWVVDKGYLDDFVLSPQERTDAVNGFYNDYEDSYEVEENFVRSYFRSALNVPDAALDFIDVDKAYESLVEGSDRKFYRLDLGGNSQGFALFTRN